MRLRVRPVEALLAGALVVAALLALWLVPRQADPPTSGSSERGGFEQQLAALKAELAEERLARQILASEVELMREVLLEFGEGYAFGDSEGGWLAMAGEFSNSDLDSDADEEDGEASDADLAESSSGAEGSSAAKQDESVFRFDELVAAGVHEFEVERVRDLWHQLELDKLELRDRAIREGWMNSKRFKRQLEDIKGEAIDDLGECGYDSLLFGTGKNNRVIVRDVLAGSAAARAGLESGDVVLRYDDTRVWAARDLQSATSGGQRGETVTVDVERNGEKVYLRVERGPFGMFMRQDSIPPSGC